jgi:formylglycine-generating enzyme required for sulfatase activity
MQIRTLLAALAIISMTGCGGSSSTSTSSTGPMSTEVLAITLASGQSRSLGTTPTTTASSEMVFVKRGTIYVGISEVSAGQWRAVMGTRPWNDGTSGVVATPTNDAMPASNISYDDAVALAQEISQRSGLHVQLPTLATWQSLVGSSEYPWGSSSDPDQVVAYANVRETNPNAVLVGVMDLTASNQIFGLIGNVREWTSDGVLVGGSWADNIVVSGRSQSRDSVPSSVRHPLSGVRLIVSQ